MLHSRKSCQLREYAYVTTNSIAAPSVSMLGNGTSTYDFLRVHSLAKAGSLAQHAVRIAAAGAQDGERIHFGALLALEVVLVPVQRLGRHRRQQLEDLLPHPSNGCGAILKHLPGTRGQSDPTASKYTHSSRVYTIPTLSNT